MTINAGALLRRSLRRCLMAANIPFVEDKGLLTSFFVVHYTDEQAPGLYRVLRMLSDD